MPKLQNWKDELFALNVASGMSQSDAYRLAFNPTAPPAQVWARSSEAMSKEGVRARVGELRHELATAADGNPGVASKLELMQYLTRAIRTPLSEIDEHSDLAQEVKVIESDLGKTIQIKAVNKLGAVQQVSSIAQYTAPQVQSLSLHLHNHEAARTNSLEDAAKTLALEFAANSTVIDLEPIPVEQPKPRKTKR